MVLDWVGWDGVECGRVVLSKWIGAVEWGGGGGGFVWYGVAWGRVDGKWWDDVVGGGEGMSWEHVTLADSRF